MNPNFLDFEQPIADLQAKIEELRLVGNDNSLNIGDEISRLQDKSKTLTEDIFGKLTSWQIARLARHPRRPYTLDYIDHIFTEFDELHGDRHFSDDAAIVGGIARLDDQPVMVIGHQKGREVREKVRRNFGMPRPEGYRKACRLMEMAERFKMPILTFIDTPGAYPGIDAEERNQSEAIAWNLRVMARLKTPIIATVIGEGGSGGALAIGVCDQLNMLQYSTYAVISPEGCASILWKTAEKAPDAAEAMGITADRLKGLGIVDKVIAEPLGGAHRDPAAASATIRAELCAQLDMLKKFDNEALLARRYERLMSYGLQARSHIGVVSWLTYSSFAAVTCDEINSNRQTPANPGPLARRPGLADRLLRRTRLHGSAAPPCRPGKNPTLAATAGYPCSPRPPGCGRRVASPLPGGL